MMTIRRAAIALLVVLGGWLIVVGIQGGIEKRRALRVVDGFLEAVRDGDRDVAYSFLEADRRAEFEARWSNGGSPFGKPTAGFSWRVNALEIKGNDARAQLFIEKDGFVLEPVIHLVRTPTTSWKIRRIDNLRVDPRWEDIQRELSRKDGEATARELQDALRGRKGVTVKRGPIPSREPVEKTTPP